MPPNVLTTGIRLCMMKQYRIQVGKGVYIQKITYALQNTARYKGC
jgi:hypothetical protein